MTPPLLHWRKAAEQFLFAWQSLDCVEGALVTGSQVIGTATPESDVDIHIVLSPETTWRERGNQMVGGHLIEYFANPTWRYPLYLEEDLQTPDRAILTQLMTGHILFDKRGEVGKVVAWAEGQRGETQLLGLDATALEVAKYHLWDALDGLGALYHETSSLFDAAAGQLLGEVMRTYQAYLRVETPAFSKLHKFFTDPTVAAAYRMKPFPDAAFVTLFLAALEGDHATRWEALQRLTNYVLEQMGGFNIDGWRLRSPA